MKPAYLIVVVLGVCVCSGCGKSMDDRQRQAPSAELKVDEELIPKLSNAWSRKEIMELLGVKSGMTVDELERRIGTTCDIFQFPDGTYGMGYYFRQGAGYKPITFIIDETGTTVEGMVHTLKGVLVAMPEKPDRVERQE